jgi:archaemetzincin
MERIMKEILHELGHNFGLLHCRDWDCVMHASASIEQVDIKGSYYCDSCTVQVPELKIVSTHQ